MKIYDCDDYKKFVNNWIQNQNKGGHGQLRSMAKHLGTHATLMSHIFNGAKDLNLEQALLLAEYMKLSEMEEQFFILLVNYARAGTVSLKKYFYKQLEKIRTEALDLKNRLKKSPALTMDQAAQFYSNWYFSAVRLNTDISNFNTVSKIAENLGLGEELVQNVLNFLVESGLCIKKDKGYNIGPSMTHVNAQSPFVINHHKNWRLRALEKHPQLGADELAFTFPLAASKSEIKKIKKNLVAFIEDLQKQIAPSASEKLMCLNIDWFRIGNGFGHQE